VTCILQRASNKAFEFKSIYVDIPSAGSKAWRVNVLSRSDEEVEEASRQASITARVKAYFA